MPDTSWLLDQLSIQPGWQVLDVGCGPLGILDLLAARVGPQGLVTGLECEPRFRELAEQIVTERGLPNVRLIQGDAEATGLPRAAYDLVHERLLLTVVRQPETVVTEMSELVRPGGIVALEDVVCHSWVCAPPHPAWAQLFRAWEAVIQANGQDSNVGRRLPGLLRAAGLVDVSITVHAHVTEAHTPRQLHFLHFTEVVRERILTAGLLSKQELDGAWAALRAHLLDPGTIVFCPLLVQAWGRRPT